ncbi:response regulator [Paenibacillus athensensis]|uniref:AraC family transcriptional regulator n=2 Tax=Paenibacillus athensensis TaxID=1967502 RepID=A0A4Y8Q155_9BACL|nr:response regulator [Paenibacillus athensensis]
MIIVDDEVETRDALFHYFPWDELGFDIVERFKNGREALEYLVSCPDEIDVVFSDIKMPVMTGIELAKELFERKSKAKVILLSGYADFSFARQAMIYGVKDYILKPAKYAELMEVFGRIKAEMDADASEPPAEPHKDDAEPKEYNYDEEVIAAVKAYLETHYKDATLKEAARLVRMNTSYLSNFFKLKTGQNFYQYLLAVRMNKASDQLKDIHNKIYDVSYNVGYSNPKNFTRAFKSHFGITPMEFRRGSEHEN